MAEVDAIVVGAGPVGCAVARHLRARGVELAILDRARVGRDKPCGEGLMPHGVAALARLGLSFAAPVFRGIRYVAGDVEAVGTFPRGLVGLGVRRTAFDAALAAGLDVDRGVRVVGIGRNAGRIEVRTDQGVWRARLVIAADGARSALRRWLALEGPSAGRPRWALRRHYRLADGVPLPDRVEVHLVEGAELYVTPVGPRDVNVAALCEAEVAATFRDRAAALARLARPLEARLGDPLGDALATGPLRSAARGVSAEGALLVGDAAGFVDGITGEGMSLGLEGAEIAAEIAARALAAGDLSARALQAWDRRHAALVARSRRLTELVLGGVRRRRVAERVIRHLARHPRHFDAVLAYEIGQPRDGA